MKLATPITLRQLAAVAVLTLSGSLPFAGSPPLLAGEPIQFSREKPRPTARPDETRLSRDAARQSKGLVPNNPLDLSQPINPEVPSQDPRNDRRRRTAENEKKNWMFHERGEGLEQEEEELGIRDYSLEKEDGTENSIFSSKASNSRNVGRPRLPSTLRRLPSQEPSEAPPAQSPEPVKAAKRSDTEDPPRGQPAGDHVSKDLDLRALLRGGKSSGADAASQAEAASRNTRADDLAAQGRDAQERGRSTLNIAAPGPDATRSAGPGDTFGAGIQTAAPRATPSSLAPVASRSSELNNPLGRNFGGGLNPSRPGLDSGLDRSFNNPNSLHPPALSTPYYDSRSPGFGSPASFGQRPPQNPAPSRSTWDKFKIK